MFGATTLKRTLLIALFIGIVLGYVGLSVVLQSRFGKLETATERSDYNTFQYAGQMQRECLRLQLALSQYMMGKPNAAGSQAVLEQYEVLVGRIELLQSVLRKIELADQPVFRHNLDVLLQFVESNDKTLALEKPQLNAPAFARRLEQLNAPLQSMVLLAKDSAAKSNDAISRENKSQIKLVSNLLIGQAILTFLLVLMLVAEQHRRVRAQLAVVDALRRHEEILAATVEQRTQQLQTALTQVQQLSVTDALTGCFNRRYLDEHLASDIALSQRLEHPLSLIIMDLDHFKRVNDLHGHLVGDQVLRETAMQLHKELREDVDWIARYGGEEYVVVLPGSSLSHAMGVAERLRQRFASHEFGSDGGGQLQVTASFGVAEIRVQEDAAALLARADASLYQAKAQGRNRVVG